MAELTWEPYSDGDEVGERAEHDIFEFVVTADLDGTPEVFWTIWVSTYSYAEGPGADEIMTGISASFADAKAALETWLDGWEAEQAKIEADLRALEDETELEARRIEERDALAAMEEPGA